MFPTLDPVRHVLGLDFETASRADIKKTGSWAYSLHPTTGVMVCAFVVLDEDRQIVGSGLWFPHRDGRFPPAVRRFIAARGTLLAHNAKFEEAILANVLDIETDVAQWIDTMTLSLARAFPAKLEGLARALNVTTQKDMEGHALMRRMSRFAAPHDAKNMLRLGQYCMIDAVAMAKCFAKLDPLSVDELRLEHEDRRMNRRGVYIDTEYAASMAELATRRKRELADEAFAASGGELLNATNPHALKPWVKGFGVELPKVTRKKKGAYTKTESLDKESITALLAKPDLPAPVRDVLQIRREATKATSLAKLARVGTMLGHDQRLRGSLRMYGAHTGRWSSTDFQVHNMRKDRRKPWDSQLTHACIELASYEALLMVEDSPLDALSACVRGLIAAPPGADLIGGDFASIEARGVAWLAGSPKVRVFSRYDAAAGTDRTALDPYVIAADSIGSTDRQLGKVCELGLGYGMGDLKFVDTAAKYGITLTPKEARRIRRLWKGANPDIVELWAKIEAAFIRAVENPKRIVRVGRHLRVVYNGARVKIELPSGRCLSYWQPRIVRGETRKIKCVTDEGEIVEREFETDSIRFWSVAENGKGMSPEDTYGGKLVENITQAVCRDLLRDAILRFSGHPIYTTVTHTHDSLLAEVPAGRGSTEEFAAIMAAVPKWAPGFPIAVDAYRHSRFLG